MKHSDKKSGNKIKSRMTACVILLSAAGAGVYAYAEPDGATPGSTVLNSEWSRSTAPAVPSVLERETSRRDMMPLHVPKPISVRASSNIPSEQFQSLSDSDRRKLLVMLALWSIKS